jgi:hypothetical protein
LKQEISRRTFLRGGIAAAAGLAAGSIPGAAAAAAPNEETQLATLLVNRNCPIFKKQWTNVR